MTVECRCAMEVHRPRLVVLTGGPGAGKTAVLEVVRRSFCEHVGVLPEAAGIVFGGGFPRRDDEPARRAAQRAIYRVQRELERLAVEEQRSAVVLCDRGTLDGLAYWRGDPAPFWEDELARYDAVIHLRTPDAAHGYDRSNPLRTESSQEAVRVDERILETWRPHPRRFVVDPAAQFLHKLAEVLGHIRDLVPVCCRRHAVAELGEGPPTACGDEDGAGP